MHMPCVANKGSVASVTRSLKGQEPAQVMEWASSMLFHPSPCQNLHWRNFTQAVRHLAWTKTCRMWSCAHEVVLLRFTHKNLTKLTTWYSPTWQTFKCKLIWNTSTLLNTCRINQWKLAQSILINVHILTSMNVHCFTYNNLAVHIGKSQNSSWVYRLEGYEQHNKRIWINQFHCEEPLMFSTLWRDIQVGWHRVHLECIAFIFSTAGLLSKLSHSCPLLQLQRRTSLHHCKHEAAYHGAMACSHVAGASRKYDAELLCYVACTCHVWLTRGLWPA